MRTTRKFALLFVAAVSVLLPTMVLAQLAATQIEDTKQLAGEWRGWAGNIRVRIVIKEDGTYEGVGRGGSPTVGMIVVKDGKASYKSNLTEGEVFLSQEKGRSFLKFVTSSGGIAEMERVK